uniref:TNase-like domain-containing protein n=1 Tax=Acrobeloides nanus TaxID=290746 RepID=A0A914DBQ7_9BILA
MAKKPSILSKLVCFKEFLLKEGFAKCVDWSISLATGGSVQLRDAERSAKERRLRLWRTYTGNAQLADRKSFQAKVIEIGLGDSINIEKDNGEELKIYFSSIRPPRREGPDGPAVGRQFRPLYDIPFMFEAREFLRKRLIGKRVTVTTDYIQPKSDQFPEKTCCTVVLSNQNIAEALVAKGFAKVIRYRADDDNRAAAYDALLAAEAEAEKGKKGVWADKSEDKHGLVRVQELQGDVQ